MEHVRVFEQLQQQGGAGRGGRRTDRARRAAAAQQHGDDRVVQIAQMQNKESWEVPRLTSKTRLQYKTALCPWLSSGKCYGGSSCNYAHCEDELRAKPDLRRTRLCPRVAEGGRCRNRQCTFAHAVEELRSLRLAARRMARNYSDDEESIDESCHCSTTVSRKTTMTTNPSSGDEGSMMAYTPRLQQLPPTQICMPPPRTARIMPSALRGMAIPVPQLEPAVIDPARGVLYVRQLVRAEGVRMATRMIGMTSPPHFQHFFQFFDEVDLKTAQPVYYQD